MDQKQKHKILEKPKTESIGDVMEVKVIVHSRF
jgi:hypothetical protein